MKATHNKMITMVPALLIAGTLGLNAAEADAAAKPADDANANAGDKVENVGRALWRRNNRCGTCDSRGAVGLRDGKTGRLRDGAGPHGDIGAGAQRGMGPGSAVAPMLNDPECAKAIGLDEETRAKIVKSFEEKDAAIEKNRAALQEAVKKQADLVAERADDDAVMKAVEEVGKYRTEIAKLQTGKMLELRKSLTDEQIKKLEQERRQRACSRMGSRSKGKRDDGKRGVNRLRGDRRDRRDQPARGGKARGR